MDILSEIDTLRTIARIVDRDVFRNKPNKYLGEFDLVSVFDVFLDLGDFHRNSSVFFFGTNEWK